MYNTKFVYVSAQPMDRMHYVFEMSVCACASTCECTQVRVDAFSDRLAVEFQFLIIFIFTMPPLNIEIKWIIFCVFCVMVIFIHHDWQHTTT